FGESMFTRVRDASKVALAHLIARLRVGGFRLLDTQFLTDHLARFGGVEVPRGVYRSSLDSALSVDGDFFALDALAAGFAAGDARPATMVSGPISGKLIAQLLTQTS
ncbi:MAG: leucyl/phenylalanyl-tRNA--protein transferase, partial [Sphingomonadaceae bacterium]|nr:leucyl/phenylalanyl-tRNA--protein transferase [Sphingomonadaceae bacterium]